MNLPYRPPWWSRYEFPSGSRGAAGSAAEPAEAEAAHPDGLWLPLNRRAHRARNARPGWSRPNLAARPVMPTNQAGEPNFSALLTDGLLHQRGELGFVCRCQLRQG